MIVTIFTGLTILQMHKGNGVILQSFKDLFRKGEVYFTTSPEEGVTLGPVMKEEVWKGKRYYLHWGFLTISIF